MGWRRKPRRRGGPKGSPTNQPQSCRFYGTGLGVVPAKTRKLLRGRKNLGGFAERRIRLGAPRFERLWARLPIAQNRLPRDDRLVSACSMLPSRREIPPNLPPGPFTYKEATQILGVHVEPAHQEDLLPGGGGPLFYTMPATLLDSSRIRVVLETDSAKLLYTTEIFRAPGARNFARYCESCPRMTRPRDSSCSECGFWTA